MSMSSAAPPTEALIAWLCPMIARACGMEPRGITAESRIAELELDSLTLVSVLTQAEAIHAIELGAEETLELLEAVDVRTLAAALAAIILARRVPNASDRRR